MDWSDIADKHNLSPTDRKSFFLSANTLACALSGNLTLVMAQGKDTFMSLPIGQSLDVERRAIPFREVYQATNPNVRAALDDFISEYQKWLKLT